MRQRGRKRADDRDVTGFEHARHFIEPPEHLCAAEKKIFADVVAASPLPFIASDIFLLSTFATLTHHARTASRDLRKETLPDVRRAVLKTLVELAKAQTALATKLRLVPSSRITPRTAGRKAEDHRPSAYDSMRTTEFGLS